MKVVEGQERRECRRNLSAGFKSYADLRSSKMAVEHKQAMYEALVGFVKTEWVEGPCEGNQPCKL